MYHTQPPASIHDKSAPTAIVTATSSIRRSIIPKDLLERTRGKVHVAETLSNQRFTDDLMRFRGAFVSKSKEPRRNGFPLIAEPLMRGIFEECLAVDVESL